MFVLRMLPIQHGVLHYIMFALQFPLKKIYFKGKETDKMICVGVNIGKRGKNNGTFGNC
jgi:hypothetical protein